MRKLKQFSLVAIAAGLLATLSPLPAQSPDSTQDRSPEKSKRNESDSQQASSQEWSGVLLDADCKSATPDEKCPVVENTKSFGFRNADSKYYKLDSEGNAKVATALETVDNKTGEIRVMLRGTVDGDVLKIDSVSVR